MIKLILCVIACLLISAGAASHEQQGIFPSDITLAWDANTESNLAGYNIYAGFNPGGPYDLIGTNEADNTEFTWNDLLNNLDHYFVVTAFNNEGLESGYSNEVCGYTDKNHDYGIDCEDDYHINGDHYANDNQGSGSGGGCFINTIN